MRFEQNKFVSLWFFVYDPDSTYVNRIKENILSYVSDHYTVTLKVRSVWRY